MRVLFKPLCLQLFFAVFQLLRHVLRFVSQWTVPLQAPLPMGISRQEYWSEQTFPPPGDFPHPRFKPRSPALAGGFLPKGRVVSHSDVSNSDPMDCSPPGTSVRRFSRKEYWSGLPFPSPGDRPRPGVEPVSPVSPTLEGAFFTTETPGEPIAVSAAALGSNVMTIHFFPGAGGYWVCWSWL